MVPFRPCQLGCSDCCSLKVGLELLGRPPPCLAQPWPAPLLTFCLGPIFEERSIHGEYTSNLLSLRILVAREGGVKTVRIVGDQVCHKVKPVKLSRSRPRADFSKLNFLKSCEAFNVFSMGHCLFALHFKHLRKRAKFLVDLVHLLRVGLD